MTSQVAHMHKNIFKFVINELQFTSCHLEVGFYLVLHWGWTCANSSSLRIKNLLTNGFISVSSPFLWWSKFFGPRFASWRSYLLLRTLTFWRVVHQHSSFTSSPSFLASSTFSFGFDRSCWPSSVLAPS